MIDEYATHAKNMGLPYHWWSAPGGPPMFGPHGPHGPPHMRGRHLQPGGITQLYVVDPTGFGI